MGKLMAYSHHSGFRDLTDEQLKNIKPFYIEGAHPKKNVGILLIHGFIATPDNLLQIGKQLAAHGYDVLCPLLPGHGTKPEDLENIKWQKWDEHIYTQYKLLAEKVNKIIVVGHSLGGSLALQLSLKQNVDIEKIILIAPAVFPLLLMSFGHYVVIPIMRFLGFKNFLTIGGDIKKPNGYEIVYDRVHVDAMEALYFIMENTKNLLPNIKTECHILCSPNDHALPPKKMKTIFELIGSKKKSIKYFENSYHVIPKDYDSDELIKSIIDLS